MSKRRHRPKIRAHANPLSEADYDYPVTPAEVDWGKIYPDVFKSEFPDKTVRIADIGCGFGGLLVNLSPLFPRKLILGLEIRDIVVSTVEKRIQHLQATGVDPPRPAGSEAADPEEKQARKAAKKAAKMQKRAETTASEPTGESSGPATADVTMTAVEEKAAPASAAVVAPLPPAPRGEFGLPPFANISVLRANVMKHCVNFFQKGQLEKMFFCFADPHFKKSNHRRRIISPNFLDVYAYVLQPNGIAYTITDVKELHEWMAKHFREHPLFEEIPEAEWKLDPCVTAMENTDEGKKVSRQGGSKYVAIFRRKPNPV